MLLRPISARRASSSVTCRDAPEIKNSRASEVVRWNGTPASGDVRARAQRGPVGGRTAKARNDLAHEGYPPNHIIEELVAVVQPDENCVAGRAQVLELPERVSDCDYVHSQTEVALAYAEQRLQALRQRYERARRPGA